MPLEPVASACRRPAPGRSGALRRHAARPLRRQVTHRPEQRIADVNVARIDHSATLLADGRVLIAGGWDADGSLGSQALLYEW